MALKFGEKIINQLYLGDKRIAKAFLGDKLVYKSREPIFLEYIEFDGASWIDTGISYQDCTVECGLTCPATSDRELMGWASYASTYWGITNSQLELGGGVVLTESDTTKYSEVKIEVSISDKRYVTLSHAGNSVNREGNIGTGTYNYAIGALPNTYSYGFTGNLYFHRFISPDGVLIQDLRPCIHPNGTVCFYDMVTKKYFYNKGSGTLTAGNKISFVDYIAFDGDSYIDTLFKPNPHTTRTVLDCMLLDNTSSGGQGIFGSRPYTTSSIDSMNIWFNTSDAPKKLRFDCTGNYQTLNTNIIDITQRLLIDCLDNSATVNGVTYSANVDKSNTTYLNYSMYLGNFNNVGKPYTKGCKMNVYRFTIYDNGVLIQDLKPCIFNGVACFYDMVTGNLFYNQGTGTLKASGRFVKSILFDGASFIDTGITHQTCDVECCIRFEENGTRQLMGFGSSTGQYWGKPANSVILEGLSGTNVTDKTNVVINFNTDDTTAPTIIRSADGRTSAVSVGKSMSYIPYTIGCLRGSATSTVMQYAFTGEVWSNKFTIGGEVVQDLRPYVDEDGVACFYDTITNVKFYNMGTGTLSYTE